MDNYVNDKSQQTFHFTDEFNIENNIKIRISMDCKMPVEISHNSNMNICRQNSFCNCWQNDSTLTKSLHHGKEPSGDKGIRGRSEIDINCKPYKINMKRHRKYSFTKAGDDKLPEVETPKERKQERRNSLDSSWQTPKQMEISEQTWHK